MPPHQSSAALLKDLQEHNAFFDELVDMIPAKLYIAGNTGEWKFCSWYQASENALLLITFHKTQATTSTIQSITKDSTRNPKKHVELATRLPSDKSLILLKVKRLVKRNNAWRLLVPRHRPLLLLAMTITHALKL